MALKFTIDTGGCSRMQTSRRDFLKLLGSTVTSAVFPSVISGCSSAKHFEKTHKKSPNFVFILADDLGWSQLGCYGSNFYESKNIDSLASRGMRFTDAYAAAPVCSPTRASIMTGKYPARLNLTNYIPGQNAKHEKMQVPEWKKYLPLEEKTIAEMLKPLGYQTALFGKWHLSVDKKPPRSLPYNPDKQGFGESIITYKPNKDHDPGKDAHNVEGITNRALKFLEQHRDEKFFLFM